MASKKLKVVMRPVSPVKYCRQVVGGLGERRGERKRQQQLQPFPILLSMISFKEETVQVLRSSLEKKKTNKPPIETHADGLEHSSCVTLMSQLLEKVVPVKVKAREAVSPVLAPMSAYTDKNRNVVWDLKKRKKKPIETSSLCCPELRPQMVGMI